MLKEFLIAIVKWNPIGELIKLLISNMENFHPVAQVVGVSILLSVSTWLTYLVLRAGFKNIGCDNFNWSSNKVFLFLFLVVLMLFITIKAPAAYLFSLLVYAGTPLVAAFWITSVVVKVLRRKKQGLNVNEGTHI